MAAIETIVVHDAFTSSPAPATGFDSVLVRLPDLHGQPAPGNGMIGRADGDEAPPRMVALPLRLASETAVESIADVLRTRFGARPLDCLILEQPVSLSEDWRNNNV